MKVEKMFSVNELLFFNAIKDSADVLAILDGTENQSLRIGLDGVVYATWYAHERRNKNV